METIRGLNLGGWLVLEKWMTPSLFEGFSAEDEYNLLIQLKDNAFEVIDKHRKEFITEEDFKWISDYGIDTVRIPVGHWLFEDKDVYFCAKQYLDKAFVWAGKYNLKIMLDVHAAPGCQNGFDNGGLSGICLWHTKNEYIEETLSFIEKLCITYKSEVALAGIELLNEPRWDTNINIIKDFYKKGYNIIRKHLNEDYYIIFHDAFRLDVWKEFFNKNDFKNFYLDTHMYQVFSHNDKTRNINEVIEKVSVKRLKELKEAMKHSRVIVGEWSLGIHDFALSNLDEYEKNAAYAAVGNSFLVTLEQTHGWFFWNYKLESNSKQNTRGWSFKQCVENSWLPQTIKRR